MRRLLIVNALRCAASAGLSVLVVVGATYIRNVNHTTVALALILLILGAATRWGWREALAASLVGGLAFDYFVLPPRGFALEDPEHLVTLVAFLLAAITVGLLSARLNRQRIATDKHRNEMERLYKLGAAFTKAETGESVNQAMLACIVEILPVRWAGLFDRESGKVFRSGEEDAGLPDRRLRTIADSGEACFEAEEGIYAAPVWRNGDIAGSLAMTGGSLSKGLLDAVTERVGLELARVLAARESMAAELARRSKDLMSAFLAALAHEIKGPLGTIKVSVGTLLAAKPADPEQQRELLVIIDEESARIANWVDNAIQISSREAGELVLDRKPNSIGRISARALEGLGHFAAGRTIDVRIPETLPKVVCDGNMMEKVLLLVLDNALKYSPPDSPVGLSAEFTGAEVVIQVEDHGFGIPESERQRIFEKNYRGSTAAKQVPGTGLGLAAAKSIVEAHGGEIWATHPAGFGSVFHISLPATMVVPDERIESLECR